MDVILERYPYRFVTKGKLENGQPDYRIQKYNTYTERYTDMYLCDNSIQFDMCIEDLEYTNCLLYTSPSPRDRTRSRMPSSA